MRALHAKQRELAKERTSLVTVTTATVPKTELVQMSPDQRVKEGWPNYPLTMRAVTSMAMWDPQTVFDRDSYYLPVLRYPGLYYGGESTQYYCGTFFYYEPSSNTFIRLVRNRTRIYATKVAAYRDLLRRKRSRTPVNLLSNLDFAQMNFTYHTDRPSHAMMRLVRSLVELRRGAEPPHVHLAMRSAPV